MDKLILVGRVAGAFGVKGEVRLTAFTEAPENLLDYGVLLDESGAEFLTLVSGRASKDGLLARAREVETREQAEGLRGRQLYIERATLPPPSDEDEFYLADLIGARAVSEDGETLGHVKFVGNFGAGDLLEIEPAAGGPSIYIPFTKDDVPSVDVENGVVVLKSLTLPPESLSEPEEDQT